MDNMAYFMTWRQYSQLSYLESSYHVPKICGEHSLLLHGGIYIVKKVRS